MMKRNAIQTLAVMAVFVCLQASLPGAINEFAVDPQPGDQTMPDISGGIVVWQEYVTFNGVSDWDIYGADISDPADIISFLAAGFVDDQINPAIDGNKVVFQYAIEENGVYDYDIYLADITDLQNIPEPTPISQQAGIDEINPAIGNNIVAWEDFRYEDIDIFAVDVSDLGNLGNEIWITPFYEDQKNPEIYGNTVVWQSWFVDDITGATDWDVSSTDITDPSNPLENPVMSYGSNQQNPSITNGIVVWQEDLMGHSDIYAADVTDPANPIYFAVASLKGNQENPHADGNIVVWQDDRNGSWDIYGYNTKTRREFRITDNPFDQKNPRISGDVVVWQDNRDGSWNIYAASLGGISTCETIIEGDVNGDCKVDIADLAIMAANWLADAASGQTIQTLTISSEPVDNSAESNPLFNRGPGIRK